MGQYNRHYYRQRIDSCGCRDAGLRRCVAPRAVSAVSSVSSAGAGIGCWLFALHPSPNTLNTKCQAVASIKWLQLSFYQSAAVSSQVTSFCRSGTMGKQALSPGDPTSFSRPGMYKHNQTFPLTGWPLRLAVPIDKQHNSICHCYSPYLFNIRNLYEIFIAAMTLLEVTNNCSLFTLLCKVSHLS